VRVFEVISSSTSNPRAFIPRLATAELAHGTTLADGSYSITLPTSGTKGGLMVQVTGGSYKDEATGLTRNLADQFGANGMRAIFGNISGAAGRTGQLSGTVTPFTELAFQGAGASLTDSAIAAANAKVATAFGLPDIIATKPLDPNAAFPAGSSAAAQNYTLALASLSQYQKDFGATQLMSDIETALGNQLAGGSLSPQMLTQLQASANNYAAGPNNLNPVLDTPAGNPSAPAAVHTTPATPVSLSIGGTQAISAHIAKSDGSSVPDGTTVSFSTTFGTLSATSASTLNGLASVTLTSATAGTAAVTARSGAASDSVAAISFVDPNAPASVALSAGAAQGVTGGLPVTISASVVRAAGGPVPDASAVTFAIAAGSGTLSGATTTSGGIATVNLTSSVAGASVTVSARAGTITQTISIPFIAQPTQAVVKVRTTGTLPGGTSIGALNATVTYSSGKGLSILASNAFLSGAALSPANGQPLGFLIPNATNAGQVVLGLISASGMPAGEFATLIFNIAPGNFPSAADFSIATQGLTVIDFTTSQPISGMSIAIAGVVIQ
jgi:hypothetical protein